MAQKTPKNNPKKFIISMSKITPVRRSRSRQLTERKNNDPEKPYENIIDKKVLEARPDPLYKR